jgi:tRNA A-37 threonylcarbamoyl transferase component Bud32
MSAKISPSAHVLHPTICATTPTSGGGTAVRTSVTFPDFGSVEACSHCFGVNGVVKLLDSISPFLADPSDFNLGVSTYSGFGGGAGLQSMIGSIREGQQSWASLSHGSTTYMHSPVSPPTKNSELAPHITKQHRHREESVDSIESAQSEHHQSEEHQHDHHHTLPALVEVKKHSSNDATSNGLLRIASQLHTTSPGPQCGELNQCPGVLTPETLHHHMHQTVTSGGNSLTETNTVHPNPPPTEVRAGHHHSRAAHAAANLGRALAAATPINSGSVAVSINVADIQNQSSSAHSLLSFDECDDGAVGGDEALSATIPGNGSPTVVYSHRGRQLTVSGMSPMQQARGVDGGGGGGRVDHISSSVPLHDGSSTRRARNAAIAATRPNLLVGLSQTDEFRTYLLDALYNKRYGDAKADAAASEATQQDEQYSSRYQPTNAAYCDLLTASLLSGGHDDATLHRKDLVALVVMLLDTLRTMKSLSENHLADSCTCNAVGDLDEVPIDPASPSFVNPASNPFGSAGGFSSWLALNGAQQKEEHSVSTEDPHSDDGRGREADSFLVCTTGHSVTDTTLDNGAVVTATLPTSISPRSLHQNPTNAVKHFRLHVSPKNADAPQHTESARVAFATNRGWSSSSVDGTPNDSTGGLPTFAPTAHNASAVSLHGSGGLRVRMSMSLPFGSEEQQHLNSSTRKSGVESTETPKNSRRPLRVRSVAFTVAEGSGLVDDNTAAAAQDDPNVADALADSTLAAAQPPHHRTERTKSLAPRKSLMISTTLTTFEDDDDDTGIVLVNQYLMMGEIGAGASGVVYEVTDTTTNKDYAMKMIKRDRFAQRRVSMGGSVTVTTNREVAIMKKLRHPHVVRLHEVIDDPSHNKLYLVMQLLTGGRLCPSLDAATGACEPVAADLLRRYVYQMCDGLRYLHQHNIIHRDVKPENMMLDGDGNVVLVDFGVSEVTVDEASTVEGAVGTPAFMAPEVWAGDRVSGAAADVWSLGVSVFMMLVG